MEAKHLFTVLGEEGEKKSFVFFPQTDISRWNRVLCRLTLLFCLSSVSFISSPLSETVASASTTNGFFCCLKRT